MLDAFASLPDRLDLRHSDDDTLRANNQVRASWAADAVDTYARTTGVVRESAWTALSNLLNDARHLCDALGIDWDDVSRPFHYDEDIRGNE